MWTPEVAGTPPAVRPNGQKKILKNSFGPANLQSPKYLRRIVLRTDTVAQHVVLLLSSTHSTVQCVSSARSNEGAENHNKFLILIMIIMSQMNS